MGREAYGIEYDDNVVSVARGHVDHPDRVIHGDALAETSYEDIPPVDCGLTSPPDMVESMDVDPLTNDTDTGGDYEQYLADIGTVFDNVDSVVSPGGTVFVDVSNMKFEGRVTTLAWDIAGELAERFQFAGEVVVTWAADEPGRDHGAGTYGYGYDHSYCLVFEQASTTQ